MFGGITHILPNPDERKWGTVEQVLEEAAKHPEIKLCSAERCACRKHFTVEGASVTAPHTELSELCRDGATAARIAAAKSDLREEFLCSHK